MVLVRDDVGHQHVDLLAHHVFRGVAKHVSEFLVDEDDLAEAVEGAVDYDEAGLVDVLVHVVLVVLLDGLVHGLDLLHLVHVLLVYVYAVQYVLVEVGVDVVEVAVAFVDAHVHQVLELPLRLLDHFRCHHPALVQGVHVQVSVSG